MIVKCLEVYALSRLDKPIFYGGFGGTLALNRPGVDERMTAPFGISRMHTAKSMFSRWLLLMGLLILALGCGPTQVEDDLPFDVLIYVLDACRPDRIGAYGYERPTTPALDALAADPDAVTFTRHYVAANWTKPATASLFTGRYVFQHGVTDLPTQIEGDQYKSQTVSDNFVTLAESFQDAGFSTLGLVTSLHLLPEYGFAQGFDTYFDPKNLEVGDGERISKFLDVVSNLDSSYFSYIHQNACHHPFPSQDRDPQFMDEYGFAYDEESRKEAGVDFTTSAVQKDINLRGMQLTPEDARFLSLIYDAKLRKVDRKVVTPMIEGLRKIDRWNRTLFIVTADHGEELYEHGGYAHAHALWEEVIRVPLIVKFPKGMRPSGLGSPNDTLSSSIDLYPSLLNFLGRPIPEGLPGRPLFEAPKSRLIFSQGVPDWAAFEGSEKLIWKGRREQYLFDLKSDPLEKNDLSESRPERRDELRELVETTQAQAAKNSAPEIDTQLSPEAVEKLRSLGYLN